VREEGGGREGRREEGREERGKREEEEVWCLYHVADPRRSRCVWQTIRASNQSGLLASAVVISGGLWRSVIFLETNTKT
jgi:hypothetical protein